jgi:hypothetical protein
MFSILTYHGTPSKKASIVESLFSHLKKKKKKKKLTFILYLTILSNTLTNKLSILSLSHLDIIS